MQNEIPINSNKEYGIMKSKAKASKKNNKKACLKDKGEKLMERTIKNKFTSGKLTNRERFRRVMHYQNVDRIPNFEFGYWDETLPTWHSQGLPPEIDNEEKAYKFFGIDSYKYIPIKNGLIPQFEEKEMINVQSPPAPLFRDPIYDGAADPAIVYNHLGKYW